MIDIYGKVVGVYDSLENKPDNYMKGFRDCLYVLKYAIKTHTQYKTDTKIHELEKLKKENAKEIKKLLLELNAIREKSNLKLLLTVQPLDIYHSFLVKSKVGSFEVVVNMDKGSFDVCLTSFSITHDYINIEQAKSKLIQFINLKNGQGYKAYKNVKEAIKEGVIVK